MVLQYGCSVPAAEWLDSSAVGIAQHTQRTSPFSAVTRLFPNNFGEDLFSKRLSFLVISPHWWRVFPVIKNDVEYLISPIGSSQLYHASNIYVYRFCRYSFIWDASVAHVSSFLTGSVIWGWSERRDGGGGTRSWQSEMSLLCHLSVSRLDCSRSRGLQLINSSLAQRSTVARHRHWTHTRPICSAPGFIQAPTILVFHSSARFKNRR